MVKLILCQDCRVASSAELTWALGGCCPQCSGFLPFDRTRPGPGSRRRRRDWGVAGEGWRASSMSAGGQRERIRGDSLITRGHQHWAAGGSRPVRGGLVGRGLVRGRPALQARAL